MRQSVLQITQTVLSSLDSDNVNSIGDTEESLQVANIIKDVYLDFIQRIGLPEHKTLFELEASGDPDKPLLMYRPENVKSVDWIKYDRQDLTDDSIRFDYIEPLEFSEFIDRMYSLRDSEDETVFFTHTLAGNSIQIFGRNNVSPSYWSSFDDSTIVFDSYDSSVDTTLQKNKTVCWGIVEPDFDLTDDFVPDLDAQQFPVFIQEVKEQAFAELKQLPNSLAARKARRGNIVLQKKKRALPTDVYEMDRLPNYGRGGSIGRVNNRWWNGRLGNNR